MKRNKTKLALVAKLFGGLCLMALLVFNVTSVVDSESSSDLSLASLVNSAQAQNEGGSSGGSLWKKSTSSCSTTLSGQANTTIKIFGISYTFPTSGHLTLTFSDVATDCASGGNSQCSYFSCADFWKG